MKYVVKFAADWADEFEMVGIRIFTVEELFSWEAGMKEEFGEGMYFGTNEFFEWASYEDLMNSIKITEVSDEFAKELQSILGSKYELGFVPS